MKEAYDQFKQESNMKISYSKCFTLRPKSTKTMGKDKFQICCCEYCENITLKKKAVNAALQSEGHHNRLLGTKFDLADLTCCPPDPSLKIHKKCALTENVKSVK